jgi:hypothetical protein
VKTVAASEVLDQYSLGNVSESDGPKDADETEGETSTGAAVTDLIMQRATELDDHVYSFARRDADAVSHLESTRNCWLISH